MYTAGITAKAASDTHAPAHQIWRGPRKMLTYLSLMTVMLPGAGLNPPGGGPDGIKRGLGGLASPAGPPARRLPGPCVMPPGPNLLVLPILTWVLVLLLLAFTCVAPRLAVATCFPMFGLRTLASLPVVVLAMFVLVFVLATLTSLLLGVLRIFACLTELPLLTLTWLTVFVRPTLVVLMGRALTLDRITAPPPAPNERAPPNERMPPPNGRMPPPNGRMPPPNERMPPPNGRMPPPNERMPPPNERMPPPKPPRRINAFAWSAVSTMTSKLANSASAPAASIVASLFMMKRPPEFVRALYKRTLPLT